MYRNRWWNLSLGVVALMSFTVALSGCGGFFVCEGKASCPSSGTTSGTGDFVYVTNSQSGTTYINGYQVTSGSFVSTTGGAVNLTYQPRAMVTSTNNQYLYIGTDTTTAATTTPELYGYSIGTGGALTALGGGVGLYGEPVLAMDVSPDGQWLFALNADWTTVERFGITSTGTLSGPVQFSSGISTSGTGQPFAYGSLKVAPSGQFIAVQVAGQGTSILPLTTSSGLLGTGVPLTESSTIGNFALAVDSSNYVYVVMGGGLYVYSVNSSGAPNPATALTGSPYAIGSPGSPSAMTISTGNNYLYVATAVSNLIYGFTGVSGNGTLTAMAPTSVAAPPGVAALGRDSDGTYLLAGGYSALSGLQLYTIGSAGLLKPGPSVVNPVSTVPMTIAFTH